MTIIINKKLCPAGLKNNPNKNLTSISYITIHCTGNYNSTATAKSHADYLYTGSDGNKASWHYTIDSKEIWQSFEDTQACWHAGDGSGPGNTSSIGLEICVNDQLGFKQACENAAWLVAELLKKHNLGVDKIAQHNRWSDKNCPAELRSGVWGVTWEAFIGMVIDNLNTIPKDQTDNVATAIDILVKYGVINSPDYWLANYTKLEYLDRLILNMANKLMAIS